MSPSESRPSASELTGRRGDWSAIGSSYRTSERRACSPGVFLEEAPLELGRARVVRARVAIGSLRRATRPAVIHSVERTELDLPTLGATVVEVALTITPAGAVRHERRVGALATVLLGP